MSLAVVFRQGTRDYALTLQVPPIPLYFLHMLNCVCVRSKALRVTTAWCHSGLLRACVTPAWCHSGLPRACHSGLHKSIQCHVMLKSSRLCKHTSMHAIVLLRSYFRRSRAFYASCGCVKRPCIDTIIQLHRFTKYATSLIS